MRDQHIAALDARLRKTTPLNVPNVRAVRRELSRTLRGASAKDVVALATQLVARDESFDRFIACEIVAHHPAALASLDAKLLRQLGDGMDSWDDVDVFACYLAGPAWREGQVTDAEVRRWLASTDRWWRRTAVVATVALNNKARGGRGDAPRTLAICERALGDSDIMVVKALSWALRELAKREPKLVKTFVATHDARLPALVRREVANKLTTGLKNPGANKR